MEAYYLDHFWIPMLRYNKLRIYLSQASTNLSTDMDLAKHLAKSDIGNNINAILDTFAKETEINNIDNNLKEYTSKWDFQAVSNLSHDLSERTLIGEYRIISLRDDEYDSDAESVNFISIGEATKPLKLLQNPNAIYSSDEQETFTAISLAQYIYEKHATDKKSLTINERIQIPLTALCPQCVYKGFRHIQGEEIHVTQHPQRICLELINSSYCSRKKLANSPEYGTEDDLKANPSCQLADKNHIELAQLILWRENAKNSQDRCFFHVALIGSSGPATLALTTLLIGNEQKENAFIGNYRDDTNNQSISKFDKHLLCKLQEKAREQFISKFEENLKQSVNEPEYGPEYINLIKYTVITYLDKVLYRYFFPFLSEKEINCIYNGLDFFIRSMKADKESPFFITETNSSFLTEDKLLKIVKEIPDKLKLTLESFRGLEAFYEVTVEHSLEGNHIPSYDNRVVTDINMSSKIALNCFFI